MATKQITVRVDQEDYEFLGFLSDELEFNPSRTRLAEQAVKEFVARKREVAGKQTKQQDRKAGAR